MEASVPGIEVEAAQHLREDASEGISDTLEVFLGDSLALDVLISQMFKVLFQDEGVVEQVDQEVSTVGDTDQVGFVLATFRFIDLDSLEESSCSWVVLEQVLKDGSDNGHPAVSER